MSTKEIRISADSQRLFSDAATEFARIAADAVSRNDRFTVALSGGSTPRNLYSLLASDFRTSIPWGKTLFFWGDERHVPPDSPESNYHMAYESMLSKVPVPPENIFRVPSENPDASVAANFYQQTMIKAFTLASGEAPCFDLILLGMGPDGHVASLFPGTTALTEMKQLVVANWVEKFKTYRITFTFPVLNNGKCVMFLAAGSDKAAMLKDVLEGKRQPPYPSQFVNPVGRLLWMIDRPAAADLSKQ